MDAMASRYLDHGSGVVPRAGDSIIRGVDRVLSLRGLNGSRLLLIAVVGVAALLAIGVAVVGCRQCSMALDVTTEEFVRVSVPAGDMPAKVCDDAKKAAGVVAGRLSA